jgi:hypothetical protein
VRPRHYVGHYQTTLTLCDYASAGNGWSSENLFRVWLPQPLFLRHMYPADTWKLMCPGMDACPVLKNGGVRGDQRDDFNPEAADEADQNEPVAAMDVG